MAKVRTVYRCQECGTAAPQWAGRCAGCGGWNSLVEEVESARSRPAARLVGLATAPVPITDVDTNGWTARATGVAELDRVLGGGLVPGSVTLVGGEPGIGKSTLLLQLLGAVAAAGRTGLLVCGEESTQQVRARAERLGALNPWLFLLAETLLPHVVEAVESTHPEVVVVDSIQTIADPDLESAPGTVAEVRDCAAALVEVAKSWGVAVLLVGHVTKDGSIAGPRVLEHVVDTVLSFEGDRHHALRLLRGVKHRFGSTAELGVFEMTDAGLREVSDPSALFLGDRRPGVAGSAVVAILEGHRPMLVEVQSLVAESKMTMPRRSAQGIDQARLALVLAVLEQRAGIALGNYEVYASAVGGVRATEPGADLGLALALASSACTSAVPADVVACGEVGLGGELRQVGHTTRRLAEAARLGFRRAVVPASAPDGPAGMKVDRVSTLREAVALLGFSGG